MRPSSWPKENVNLESFNVSQISDLVKSRLEAYNKDVKDMKSKRIEKQGNLESYKFDFLFSLGLYIKLEILKEAKELLNNSGSISDMQNWIRERELEFRTRIKQLKQK